MSARPQHEGPQEAVRGGMQQGEQDDSRPGDQPMGQPGNQPRELNITTKQKKMTEYFKARK